MRNTALLLIQRCFCGQHSACGSQRHSTRPLASILPAWNGTVPQSNHIFSYLFILHWYSTWDFYDWAPCTTRPVATSHSTFRLNLCFKSSKTGCKKPKIRTFSGVTSSGAELGTLTKMFSTVLVGMKSKTSQRWQPMIVPARIPTSDPWPLGKTSDYRYPMNSYTLISCPLTKMTWIILTKFQHRPLPHSKTPSSMELRCHWNSSTPSFGALGCRPEKSRWWWPTTKTRPIPRLHPLASTVIRDPQLEVS